MDDGHKVLNIKVQKDLIGAESHCPHFVDILIIRRKLLLEIVEKYSFAGCKDLMDILTTNLDVLKIYGCQTDSLIGLIRSVKNYYDRSMDLLNLEVREKLWLEEDRIHTKIADNPPTRYTSEAKVSNSLIASGCTIAGEVLNSIIFRGVVVERGCFIRDSIIMPRCHIYENAQTEYIILDKSLEVHEGNVLKGNSNNPLVVYKSKRF